MAVDPRAALDVEGQHEHTALSDLTRRVGERVTAAPSVQKLPDIVECDLRRLRCALDPKTNDVGRIELVLWQQIAVAAANTHGIACWSNTGPVSIGWVCCLLDVFQTAHAENTMPRDVGVVARACCTRTSVGRAVNREARHVLLIFGAHVARGGDSGGGVHTRKRSKRLAHTPVRHTHSQKPQHRHNTTKLDSAIAISGTIGQSSRVTLYTPAVNKQTTAMDELDEKHVDQKEEKKAEEVKSDSKSESTEAWWASPYTRMTALRAAIFEQHGRVEHHLINFAHMSMADANLTRDQALTLWMNRRSSGLNTAYDGRYSLAEMLWLTYAKGTVASRPEGERLLVSAEDIVPTFRRICALGLLAARNECVMAKVDETFDKAAALMASVIDPRKMDALVHELTLDKDEADGKASWNAVARSLPSDGGSGSAAAASEPQNGKDEKKAESTTSSSTNGTSGRKRAFDLSSISAGSSSAKKLGGMDAESKRLLAEKNKQLETSPLDNTAKAVQGFLLYASRIFWHVWARTRVRESLGSPAVLAVKEEDRARFLEHMSALCELEPLEEATSAVVSLHLRQQTMVGALDFHRRAEGSADARVAPSSLIQAEVSVRKYDALCEDAGRKPSELLADTGSLAREALVIETFARQLSFQIPSTDSSTTTTRKSSVGLNCPEFQRLCILQDEVVDRVGELKQTRTGMRPRRPIMVQLNVGWALHHKGKLFTAAKASDRVFESVAIPLLRILQREFACTLASGVSLKTLCDDFVGPL